MIIGSTWYRQSTIDGLQYVSLMRLVEEDTMYYYFDVFYSNIPGKNRINYFKRNFSALEFIEPAPEQAWMLATMKDGWDGTEI